MSRQTLYDDETFHHTTISLKIFMQLGQAAAMACFSSRHASFNPTKQKWSYDHRNWNHKRLRKTKEKGNQVTTSGLTKNSFLVDLWAEKHDRLESKDARIAWQEICQEIEINFGKKRQWKNARGKSNTLSINTRMQKPGTKLRVEAN